MKEHPPVKLGDLEDALEFASFDGFDNQAWVRRSTGEVICCSSEGDFDPVPDDLEEGDRYVAVPDKHYLCLGKPLALEFAHRHLADAFDDVRAIFSRRGAYARFKDLLERRDSLQAWYDWEHEQTLQALREWCADNDLAVLDEASRQA